MGLREDFHTLVVRPGGAGRFPALDGCRALACIWVIGLHTVSLLGSFWTSEARDVHVLRPPEYVRLVNDGALRVLVKGDLAVDLFFVLSGFLIATALFREQDATGSIAVTRFYQHRFLRLMPAYALALAAFAVLGEGGDPGRLWTNLLYVNNFVPTYDQFMLHAWSLAVEEQFYLLFPLLLVLLHRVLPGGRGARWGTPVWIGLIALGLGVRALVVLRGQLWAHTAPSPLLDRGACAVFNDALYDKFHTRFGAILCGVLAAHAYATGASRRFFASRRVAPAAAFAAALLVTAVVISPAPAPGAAAGAATSADPITVGVFLVLYQTAFAAAAAFVLLAVLHDWAPVRPLRWLLTARCWHPLAKLSYAAYLVHPLVIERVYASRPPEAPSAGTVFGYFVAFAAVSFALAVPIHLFVELPGMRRRSARPASARPALLEPAE